MFWIFVNTEELQSFPASYARLLWPWNPPSGLILRQRTTSRKMLVMLPLLNNGDQGLEQDKHWGGVLPRVRRKGKDSKRLYSVVLANAKAALRLSWCCPRWSCIWDHFYCAFPTIIKKRDWVVIQILKEIKYIRSFTLLCIVD